MLCFSARVAVRCLTTGVDISRICGILSAMKSFEEQIKEYLRGKPMEQYGLWELSAASMPLGIDEIAPR